MLCGLPHLNDKVDNEEVEMSGDLRMSSGDENQVSYTNTDDMPILRIGLMENRDSVEFKATGRFSVLNDQGVPILNEVASPVKWRVKITPKQPAKYVYNILLGKFMKRHEAHELEYQLIERGIGTRIKSLGGKLYYGDRVVNENAQCWVVVDGLPSEEDAQKFARERLNNFTYRIEREKIHEPLAKLELFDSEFEKLGETENVIRIVPESPNVFTYVYDTGNECDFQHSASRHRMFLGPIEFRSTNEGKILIVCEMPLEKYIESVVALEVKPEYPIELIKAQAITVRSRTIASLGVKHSDDMFHLCAGAHCQVFTGIRELPEDFLKAVQQTMGIVLRNDQGVIDANSTLVCGGHTEAPHNIMEEGNLDPFPAIFDGANARHVDAPLDLTLEENLRQWVREEPDVYCNLSNVHDANNQFQSLRSHFRWRVSHDRNELAQIINSATGNDIGDLFDIVPVQYGVSGRIFELEILASNKNMVLKGEHNIRKMLSPGGLPSSCFCIESQMDDDGFPISFTFKGAGNGHGVGLCQAGAINMALQGKDHADILSHYFQNVELRKIY